MKTMLTWLAKSPIGTALKVGVSAALVWLLQNLASLNLDPVAQALAVAVGTVLINALNPQDSRYGITAGD